ncbi:D-glycerate dehydrogenase [Staphylococcus epidermidis]|nr:D-glycerate dehydrogenase [Staphylococcus epidermidis]MBM6232580.1 D-glycerate dehydrogenase [Staphylococcus epidermidis]MBM6234866.1 D-glycerate dehydrogenase [Staphylococcus epidermidis]MBM6237102.1 D-glycerate dehydrogenase [Staphylococcus epidermidis]MBM6239471.1 D-glycerate dehydrogenase [Staphylococcus epidermidis]
MNKILVTRQIPQHYIEQLKKIGQVVMWEHDLTPMSRESFLANVEDATACVITLSEHIDEEVFLRAQQLKVIANMAVGFDNIDITLAKKHGVVVTNTPHVLTETTAELGFTLMLTVARRIIEATSYIQEGKWKSWGPYLLSGKDVYGATVGIFGMGDIGKAFARRLQGFDARIIYHNRKRDLIAERKLNATYVTFSSLLEQSDFIICTAPLTKETENQFDNRAFNKMKNDAVFINIGRGAIVDEEALLEALKNHEIQACGLDVMRQEPIQPDHPILKLPNAVVLPHIGSSSQVTRNRMVQLCIDNIKAVLNNDAPLTPVTPLHI